MFVNKAGMRGKMSKREVLFYKSLRNFSRVVTNLLEKGSAKSLGSLTLKIPLVDQLVSLNEKLSRLVESLKEEEAVTPYNVCAKDGGSEAVPEGKDTVDHPRAPEPEKPREPLRLPLKKRKVKVLQLNPLECPVCHRILSTKAARHNHIVMMHSSERPFKCSVCSRGFPANYLLQYHLKTHDTPKYECRYCEKTFTRRFLKTQHEETHVGSKEHKCPTCGKAFLRASNLKLHLQVHQKKKSFQCSDCGAGFSHKLDLDTHTRKHTGVGLHPCEKCEKVFTRSVELKRHYVSHEETRSHLCSSCGKGFKYAASLKHHVKVSHSSDQELRCDLCPLTFSSGPNFRKHVEKHKTCPFDCAQCHQLFTSRAHLNRHLKKVHSDSAFVCSCGASFVSSEKLAAHTKVHLLNAVCNLCNKRFKTEKNLFFHKKKCHPGEYALLSALGNAVEVNGPSQANQQAAAAEASGSEPKRPIEQFARVSQTEMMIEEFRENDAVLRIVQNDGSILTFLNLG